MELSVWSEHFYKLLYRHQGEEITIEDADPETLGTLVRAMYEKEVSPIYTIFDSEKDDRPKFYEPCFLRQTGSLSSCACKPSRDVMQHLVSGTLHIAAGACTV